MLLLALLLLLLLLAPCLNCLEAVKKLFFFNDTATTEIYTLSLHDALPIYHGAFSHGGAAGAVLLHQHHGLGGVRGHTGRDLRPPDRHAAAVRTQPVPAFLGPWPASAAGGQRALARRAGIGSRAQARRRFSARRRRGPGRRRTGPPGFAQAPPRSPCASGLPRVPSP